MDFDLLDVDRFPDDIDGVHVIAAVEGFLVTLDPKGVWPVLHPYSPNVFIRMTPQNDIL